MAGFVILQVFCTFVKNIFITQTIKSIYEKGFGIGG